MDDAGFEAHLPEELRAVADALSADRAIPDVQLLERVERHVTTNGPSWRTKKVFAWRRPHSIAGLAVAAMFGLNVSGAVGLGSTGSVLSSIASSVSLGNYPQPAAVSVYCTPAKTINFRWHYQGQPNYPNTTLTSGSWSGTGGGGCPNSNTITLGPQAMEGDLKVKPGSTIYTGYDFTLPGFNGTTTVTITNAKVVFNDVHCASGQNPTQSSFTVTMPPYTVKVTSSGWYPSGDQSSALVRQGMITVPNVCGGGLVRLDKGGTFSATYTFS
jgi:hypothetical protein